MEFGGLAHLSGLGHFGIVVVVLLFPHSVALSFGGCG